MLESPINLDINGMKDIELAPLEWTGFDVAPRKLKITNTGSTGNLFLKVQFPIDCGHSSYLSDYPDSKSQCKLDAGTSLPFWRATQRKLRIHANSLSLGGE